MKKQINPTIKAHLVRGAFYLLLLLAVCAIPFVLAARNTAAGKISRTLSRTRILLIFPLLRRRVPFEFRCRSCQTLKQSENIHYLDHY